MNAFEGVMEELNNADLAFIREGLQPIEDILKGLDFFVEEVKEVVKEYHDTGVIPPTDHLDNFENFKSRAVKESPDLSPSTGAIKKKRDGHVTFQFKEKKDEKLHKEAEPTRMKTRTQAKKQDKPTTIIKSTAQKRRELEEAAKKREAQEKKRAFEEKQLKAQQQREVVAEQKRLKTMEKQRLKEERCRKYLAEQEEKLQKKKEEQEKKRRMAKERKREEEKRVNNMKVSEHVNRRERRPPPLLTYDVTQSTNGPTLTSASPHGSSGSRNTT